MFKPKIKDRSALRRVFSFKKSPSIKEDFKTVIHKDKVVIQTYELEEEGEKCCCFRGNNAVLWGYFIAFMIPAVCGGIVFASPYILHEILKVDERANQTADVTIEPAGWFWDSKLAKMYCYRMPCNFLGQPENLKTDEKIPTFDGFNRTSNSTCSDIPEEKSFYTDINLCLNDCKGRETCFILYQNGPCAAFENCEISQTNESYYIYEKVFTENDYEFYEPKQIEYEELEADGSGLGSLTDDEDFL